MTHAAASPLAGEPRDLQKLFGSFLKKHKKKDFFLKKEAKTFLCFAGVAGPAHAAHESYSHSPGTRA
jgi:hypothetical protein